MKVYVNNFKGFAPKVPSRNKPTNFADITTNTDLSTGDIRMWDHQGTYMNGLPSGVPSGAKCMFKWHFKGTDYWWGSTSYDKVNATSIHIPDSTSGREQLYWLADGGTLMVCEGDDLLNYATKTISARSIVAGIDKPSGQITLGIQGTALPNTQPTVYSYVVCFGRTWNDGVTDIGPASDPAKVVYSSEMSIVRYPGQQVVLANITGMNKLGNNTNQAFIYRSAVSSSGAATYQLAGRMAFAINTSSSTKLTFTDDFTYSGETLQSMYNTPLPAGAHSFISLNNGLYCAAKGATVYVSNLNRPYAFPQDYTVTITDEIVALGSFGNTVVALTKNEPVLITIADPSNPVIRPLQDPNPCVSKWAVVSTARGVIYASTVGALLLSSDTPKNLTEQLYDVKQWTEQNPSQHYYAFFGNTLYMFNRGRSNYQTLSFDEFSYNSLYGQLTSSGLIEHDDFYSMDCGWWDPDTQTYYAKPTAYNRLYVFKMYPQNVATSTCTWRSKVFVSAQGAWRPAVVKVNQETTCDLAVYLDGKNVFNKRITGSKPVKMPAGYTGTEVYFVVTVPSTYSSNIVHSVTVASSMVECLEGEVK